MKRKTFKEYTVDKKAAIYPFGSLEHETEPGKYPEMETCCGAHSVKPSDTKFPDMETVFGTHGTNPVTEEYSTEPGKLTAADQVAEHKTKDSKLIHASNKIGKTESLENYSTSSTDINNSLHTRKVSPSAKKQINSIDRSMDRASIDKDTHVFTGLKDSPAKHFVGLKSGETAKVHLPAYTSTSTRYKIASNFTHARPATQAERQTHTPLNSDHKDYKKYKTLEHVLKIHLPKGTKAGSIRHFASHDTEDEILLHRGHNIEIHPHPTVDEFGNHTWHARIISHTPEKV